MVKFMRDRLWLLLAIVLFVVIVALSLWLDRGWWTTPLQVLGLIGVVAMGVVTFVDKARKVAAPTQPTKTAPPAASVGVKNSELEDTKVKIRGAGVDVDTVKATGSTIDIDTRPDSDR